MPKRHLGPLICVFILSPGLSRALEEAELDNLEIEMAEILQTKIESASKTQEALLDAPLSSTVITQEQIRRAGARTIMEALRLAPGLIVREQTTGNYDIHLRGFDNVPPDSLMQDFASNTILVMIDYRVVYNYYLGGTFWDALPVDIDDVDRIEIVRGPAAALYGPNAVTGVIHIITRRPARTGVQLRTSVELDPANLDRTVRASAGFGDSTWSALLSANYSELARAQSAIYSPRLDDYVDDPAKLPKNFSDSFIDHPDEEFPELDLALRRIGANGFFEFNPAEQVSLRLSGGYQNSRAQKILVDRMYAFLSTYDSETGYADLRAKLWGFTAHTSLLAGHQDAPNGGALVNINGVTWDVYTYDFTNIDADLDTLWEWSPWTWAAFQLRPSLAYRFATYDGILLAKRDLEGNPVDSKVAMQSVAGSLRAEVRLFERLRLIGGVRLDYHPDRTEDNYYTRTSATPITREGQRFVPALEFAATYRFSESHLVRAVYSRSSASPFVIPSYQNDSTQTMVTRLGNRAADLRTAEMFELGLRSVFGGNLSVDIEIFHTTMWNFQQIFFRHYEPWQPVFFQFDNLDDVAAQLGLTLSLQAKLGPIDAQLFFTLQQTKIQNHAKDTLRFFEFDYDPRDPANQTNLTHRGTPDLYGGLVATYRPIEDLGLNLNLYYYTRHTMTRGDLTIGLLDDATYQPAVYEIRENLLVNLVANYRILGGLQAYVDLRNLFNIKQQEFPGGDRKRAAYLLGLKFDY